MAQFLVALVLLIVTYPFVIGLQSGEVIEDLLLMVIFVSAALAVGGGRWPLTILLITPAIVCAGVRQYRHWLVPIWVVTATHSIFVAFVVFQLYRFVRGATRVTAEVMNAGIAGYLMLGILWTPTYLLVSQLDPNSFSGAHLGTGQGLDRFDALFLSFVSLTCLGCNDITPLSRTARMLLMVEALSGVLYLAVLIARLVSLYSSAMITRRATVAGPENQNRAQDSADNL
jgi:hypothetical protein